MIFDPSLSGCQDAIAVANARIGWLHWPITKTTAVPGLPCPPGARCRFSPTTWSVIFAFWAGDPVMVVVTRDESGVVSAADPEPVPSWMPVR